MSLGSSLGTGSLQVSCEEEEEEEELGEQVDEECFYLLTCGRRSLVSGTQNEIAVS